MHPAHVNHFSFPGVTLRVLSDHYTEVLRNATMKFWREEKYKKAGRKAFIATVRIPASEKSKHALLTFHFHVAAGALVILDTVTMQFLRGKGETVRPDDAQLRIVINNNQLEEVIFFCTTRVADSHTFSSHLEHHEMGTFFSYIEEKHQREKKYRYHWMHLITKPDEEAIVFVSSPSLSSTNLLKNTFTYDKKRNTFTHTEENDEIPTESYVDTLQSLLGMLPLNML